MRFLMTFEKKNALREHGAPQARFQTMGAQVPKGARLIGRWLRADQSGGFDLLETDDPDSLGQFARLWSELARVTVVPMSDDHELGLALAGESGSAMR
jgi:Protein of unknown function (DUF3303)